MKGIETVSTGPEPLQNEQSRAVLVLRLGAALNSICAAHRWTSRIGKRKSLVAEFDRFQAYLVAAAYLSEACKLFWENKDSIRELARKGHAGDDKIEEVTSIANPETGIQATLLKRIRDKETFHWDCDVFESWASDQKGEVVWVRRTGNAAGKRVMSASHAALAEFTVDRDADTHKPLQQRIVEQIVEVLSAMDHVTHIFESAVNGFLQEHGAKSEIESDPRAILP